MKEREHQECKKLLRGVCFEFRGGLKKKRKERAYKTAQKGQMKEEFKMKVINTTPHPVRFQSADGEVYEIEPCGVLVNARPVEEFAGVHSSGVMLVRTKFVADPASEEALSRLEVENPGAIILGSIIAAQAFPGRVLAMVPAPGFERVPPAEKRMRDDKFTTF